MYDGSVAQDLGLQVGDQIVSIDGRQVRTHADLVGALNAAADAGQSTAITIQRGGREYNLTADLTGQAALDSATQLKSQAAADVGPAIDKATALVARTQGEVQQRLTTVRDDLANIRENLGSKVQETAEQAALPCRRSPRQGSRRSQSTRRYRAKHGGRRPRAHHRSPQRHRTACRPNRRSRSQYARQF
ncbi:MAG: PDZ domain-containing protein [Pirellulales bacterium]